ncbi:putative RNA methyltransferase [Tomitella biformata]|uniref:putative RNA methyltransferase n=1 Tax=Tomitella biformata TaxID=630403 RepID=UPI0004BB9F8C|nr:methyltransferase domain-containing protein [Tomitella biformata]
MADHTAAGMTALIEVADALRCPVCEGQVSVEGRAVRCAAGHSFDIARQGYVGLTGGALKFTGDSPDMVAARERFLGAGHFEALLAAVAETSARVLPHWGAEGVPGPVVVELGAGTGHYLARVLDGAPSARGVAVDASKPAARRAARAHPRAASVLTDAWARLPVADGAADLVMSVFAPRNAEESARMLRPGGTVLVLTPGPGHLGELVGPLGLVNVDERKAERLEATMAGHFEAAEMVHIESRMNLSHKDIENVIGMGPSARHGDPAQRAAAIAALPERVTVTAAAIVTVFRSV